MTREKLTYLFFLIAVLAFIMWQVLGCADRRDMSRREAIDITNLAKELQ